ncbi:MAG: CoA-acylating methylmalonate-semialdehyde dehydrogenase [Thaumarchaeota archaeon]|nr:CoA-acylating methylmalonate-semialdehyde dehydrogenase [Nitrososphaerota archaeon]
MTLRSEPAAEYGTLKLFLDNEWKESASEELGLSFNPATGRVIAKVPFATKEEVDEAVESARRGYGKWSKTPITERVKHLFKLKETLENNFEELAVVSTQNHGKTLAESRGDVRRTIDNVDTAISVAYTLAKGETLDEIAPGIDEFMVRESLGVFAIVCPFNFPLMIPFWFLPYAIVLGDTVVVKPSEITPLPMQKVADLVLQEVGLPSGVFNLIHGGKEVVELLISNSGVSGVGFVGSTSAAKQVYKLAGEHGKRAIVQGGAKNSIVVMPDADLTRSIGSIVGSFFGNSGQRCLAGSNLVTVGEAHEKALKSLVTTSTKLKLGPGLEETTEMGPVVTSKAKERILGDIARGVGEGAKLVTDGRDAEVLEYPDGFYLGPSIFDDVSPDMKISKEEMFGPVASVVSAKNLDDAIEMINRGTNYGNMACIYTTNGKNAREFRMRVNAGNIGINIGVAAPAANFPFGGRRDSFFGVLHSQIDTVDFFTDKKVIVSRW